MGVIGQASQKIRVWARSASDVAAAPVSQEAREAVAALLEAAALRRMNQGVTPEGVAFQPLSPRYVARKGHSIFWQLTGASRRRFRTWVVPTGVKQIINTPYSGVVHDGAVIHYRPRTSSSL